MTDRSKFVRCIITQEGLEKLARHALTIDQFELTFHKHREGIESTASDKYDASAALSTQKVVALTRSARGSITAGSVLGHRECSAASTKIRLTEHPKFLTLRAATGPLSDPQAFATNGRSRGAPP